VSDEADQSGDALIAQAADQVLAQQARDGDREAWQQLMQRHAPRLAAYLGARIRRHDVVERLVGDAIFAAWRHIHEWPRDMNFPVWFRRIGAKLAMNWREKNRGELLSGEFPFERCEGEEQVEQMRRLEEALGQLDERERMCLEQRYRAGIGGRALAEALHCGEAEAEALHERALDRLQALLERSRPSG